MPSEVDKMPYWEYELWLRELNDIVKTENEEQQSQLEKYKINETMDNIQSGKMTNKMMPKFNTPDFGSMKMPNLGSMKTPF